MLGGQVVGQQYSDQQWAADAAEPADAQRPADTRRPDRCWIVDGGERDDAFLPAADAKAGAKGCDVENPIGASYRKAEENDEYHSEKVDRRERGIRADTV